MLLSGLLRASSAGQKKSSWRYKVGVHCKKFKIHEFKLQSELVLFILVASIFVEICMLLFLAGTQLLSTTMGVKEYVQSEFESVEAEIISENRELFPGTVTFNDFLWAFGILRSRVFAELRGDKLALIPFADLVRS